MELAGALCLGLLWDSPVCASMLSCEAEDSLRNTCHWVVKFRTRNMSDAALQGARSSLSSVPHSQQGCVQRTCTF